MYSLNDIIGGTVLKGVLHEASEINKASSPKRVGDFEQFIVLG
jgi:hypothetical protein